MSAPPTVNDAFKDACDRLARAGIDSARVDARILLGRVLGGGPERVLAEGPRAMTDAEVREFQALLDRRLGFEPMSHILGAREFWSMDFAVTAATLTPRVDSETLIEAVLDHVRPAPARILDLGTGTGCLLLALLREWPGATGLGVDISAEAVHVAEGNARALGLDVRAAFRTGGWHAPESIPGRFDLIVSNPPYIPTADIATLDADVRDFEPRQALDGGSDGLDAYRAIAGAAPVWAAPTAWLAFEVGVGQAADVAALLGDHGWDVLETRADLGGIARAVVARRGATRA